MEIVQTLITIVIFLVMLGLLVVIHELGHFVVARLANVRVLEFGIGFPPRAKVLRSEGETLYTLNWLPIGGFVKLEGEDGDSEDPRSFVNTPFWVKQLILVAGVVMNLLLALAIFTAIAWLPSQRLGLQIGVVQPGSPAEAAGLVPGDRIVSINGLVLDRFDDPNRLIDALRANAGQTIPIEVLRADGSLAPIAVTLRPAGQIERGALGIEQNRAVETPIAFTRSPVDAVTTGTHRTAEAFRLILDGLGQIGAWIATRPTEAPPAAGPVGIADQLGRVVWGAGPVATLYFAGILSANLALVNILPFPPLDGGRMLMLFIKALAGKRVSIRAERLTYLVGFGFLFAFLIWITYFDLVRLGGGG